MAFRLAFVFSVLAFLSFLCEIDGQKVCPGMLDGISHTVDMYKHMKNRFRNCTIVDGNLVVTYFGVDTTPKDADFEFLSSIEEITGYLHITLNTHVDRLPLTNLRVIHGRSFPPAGADYTDAALIITRNQELVGAGGTRGLQHVHMPNLKEVVRGNVFIEDNVFMCFLNTINWEDIVDTKSYRVSMKNTGTKAVCPLCHASCKAGCWGPTATDCQRPNKVGCAQQCDGRCFGEQANECCHGQCAGGCTGIRATDCVVS